jgi:beta-lactamase regulating signal transducer with metallopeptidase domain/thiol-disulfide isomerase/thioredoxin/protocatechuate 3,4-dioxygenase beta subunit
MNPTTLAGNGFSWVLQSSWQAAVLVLLVLIVQMIFRRKLSPAWRYGLWLLVVVRLLMPASPQSAISIFNLAKFAPPQPIAASPPAPAMGAPEAPVSDLQPQRQPHDDRAFHASPAWTEAHPVQQPGVGRSPGAVSTRIGRTNRSTNWFEMACAVWFGGVCLLALRLAWANVRFGSRLARHVPIADATILRIVEQCADTMGIRQPVSVIETEEVDSPAVCGLWKKRLLVPDGTFERFSSDELRHIFLHELAHIKRCDIEVNWLSALLQILHWFNPLLWLAFARMRADRELATDALALAHVGRTDNVHYGETILKVVENLARGAVQPGLVGIAEDKAGLKERLRAIARGGAARPWRWAAIGIAAIVAAVGLTTARQTHKPEAPARKEAAAISRNSALVGAHQRNFGIRVSDFDGGTPLNGVTVSVTLDYLGGNSIQKEALTDRDGRAAIPYTTTDLKRLGYVAQKTNFITLQGEWMDQELSLLGEEYPVKLGHGTEIGGSVVDENGKPVANAQVSFDQGMRLLLSADHYRTDHAELWIVPPGQHVAVTGPDGTWKAKCIWPDFQWASLRIHHPDFADVTCGTDLTSAMQAEGKGVKVTFDDLTKRAVRLTLTQGVAVKGHVINEIGAPLAGIKVSYAELLTSPHSLDQILGQRAITTDAAGEFQLDHLPLKHLLFMVQTPGYGPAVAELDPAAPSSEVELRLAKGIKLIGAVQDDSDNPVANARVAFADYSVWRGIHWETVTDGNGRFQWNDAPAEVFQLEIQKDGFLLQHETVDAGDGKALAIRLRHALHISGKVLDAETKQPVKAFHMVWMDRSDPRDFAEGYPSSVIPGSNGIYSLDLGRLYAQTWAGGYAHQCLFRVEADGYADFVSRVFSSHEGDVGEVSPYDVELQRTPQIFGTVVDAGGRPVPGAQVGLKMPASRLFLLGNPSFSSSARGATFQQTDAQGRFHLNTDPAAQGLVAVHEEGFAAIGTNDFSTNLTLKLQPWGRIEGTVWEYDKLVTNQAVWGSAANGSPSESLHTEFRANTDAQGRFAFDFVPPGKYSVFRMIPMGAGSSSGGPREVVQVQPAKTALVKLGGAGRPVVGRMKILNPYLAIDWQNSVDFCNAHLILPQPPTNLTTPAQVAAWRNQPAVQQAYEASRSYPIRFAADGSFRMDEVVPGKYAMQIQIYDPRDPNARAYAKYIAPLQSKEFEAPPSDSRDPLDIGVFEISLKPDLKAGLTDAPEFEATDMAGKKFKLSDYRGKYVLLDFWATWCGPCIGEIPYLKQAHEKFKDRSDFAMISLSLDKTVNEPREFLKKNDLPWLQGYLGEWSETKVAGQYGVEGIPALFLVSPDGKIIESELEGSSMIARLENYLK